MTNAFNSNFSAIFCIEFDRKGLLIITVIEIKFNYRNFLNLFFKKGSGDCMIKIWCSIDNVLLSTLKGHEKAISHLKINFEDSLLASGSFDRSIRIWDLKSKKCTYVLKGHSSNINLIEVLLITT